MNKKSEEKKGENMKTRVIKVNNNGKWILKEKDKNSTIVDMGKVVKILPFSLESSLNFLRNIGVMK